MKDPAILGKIDRDLIGFEPAQNQDYDDFEKEMQAAAKFEAE